MSKKNLYTEIKERIREKVSKAGSIALWNNQPAMETKERVKKYPAIYIEFSRIDWGANQNQVQTADILLTIHHVWETIKTEDLEMFDFIEQMHVALQGFQSDTFTGLERIAERQDTTHDRVIDWEVDFQCSLLDCSAHPNLTRKNVILTGIDVDCAMIITP